MVGVAQLVRAPDCGSGGRGFETRHSPHIPQFGRRFVSPERPRGYRPLRKLMIKGLVSQ
jgi:hypothetical protein